MIFIFICKTIIKGHSVQYIPGFIRGEYFSAVDIKHPVQYHSIYSYSTIAKK